MQLHDKKQIAPEPYFSAYVHVMYCVAEFIRHCKKETPLEQIQDLGYWTHNVPLAIRSFGPYFNDEIIRAHLKSYDDKWGADGLNLIEALDAGIEFAKRKENQ
jgi:hypothetical protein